MSRLYQESFTAIVSASFEPGKQNKFQTWLTNVFIPDPNPFYILINGEKIEISRSRIAAKALELGRLYMEENQTRLLPQGFFNQEVLPAVKKDFGG